MTQKQANKFVGKEISHWLYCGKKSTLTKSLVTGVDTFAGSFCLVCDSGLIFSHNILK